MNAFFDGYVNSTTCLKQFVEQYERALRSKVEKEFQADFKSFSQMLPCVTKFEMEQQYQSVYTITKFREVQAEFMGKVYCDILSTTEGCSDTTYEIRETIMCEGYRRRKTYVVTYDIDMEAIICTCHLFEFRGILCRHAITVLDRQNVTHIPEKYILRRWRRDIRRAHTRVPVNYDGLVSTPAQVRYEEMSNIFAQLANLAADDEMRSREIVEWIKCQCKDLSTNRSSVASNLGPEKNLQVSDQCIDLSNSPSVSILDPKLTRRKGAPKTLRRKSLLESTRKKAKSSSKSSSCKRPATNSTSMVDGGFNVQPDQAQPSSMPTLIPYLPNSMWTPLSIPQNSFSQPLPYANFIPPSANVMYNLQGQYMPFDCPSLPEQTNE